MSANSRLWEKELVHKITENSLECRSREITPLFWPSHLVWLLYDTSKMVAEEYCIVEVDIQET